MAGAVYPGESLEISGEPGEQIESAFALMGRKKPYSFLMNRALLQPG